MSGRALPGKSEQQPACADACCWRAAFSLALAETAMHFVVGGPIAQAAPRPRDKSRGIFAANPQLGREAMTEISASEKKRIIAAIKRRKPSDNLTLRSLIQRPPMPTKHRQFVQGFTQLMEKGGVDIQKLNENLKRKQPERPHLVEKPLRIDKKALAGAKRAFRYGIEERRKSARHLATLDYQSASVFLDTPVFIDPVVELNIEPWNSTAKFSISWGQDVDIDSARFNFHFFWRNESLSDVLISAASVLIAKGTIGLSAYATFGDAWVNVICSAELNILELWNDPPTSPLFEQTQREGMGANVVSAQSVDGWTDEENPGLIDVFQGFQLYHNNFFRVPARQAVEFWVGVNVYAYIGSFLDAGGNIVVDFATGDDFLLCPFVELQVLPAQEVLAPGASSRRTITKHSQHR